MGKILLKYRFVEGQFRGKSVSRIKYAETLSNFVSKTLGYFNFCVCKSTVLKKIPNNWKEMAIADVVRTR